MKAKETFSKDDILEIINSLDEKEESDPYLWVHWKNHRRGVYVKSDSELIIGALGKLLKVFIAKDQYYESAF